MLLFGDCEHLAHGRPHRGHEPGHRRRERRRVRHRRRLVPQVQRRVLGGVRPVIGVALGQILGRRRRGSVEDRAHLVDVREDEVLGFLEPPTSRQSTAGGQRSTAHQPGRPDV